MPKKPTSSWSFHRSAGLAAFCILLAAIPAVTFFAGSQPLVVLTVVIFYIVVMLILRSRLILCTLAGLLLGFTFDNQVKGGTAESKMWELVGRLSFGVMVGITVGIAWDKKNS